MAATGNLGIVQKRLGRNSIETTYKRYAHLLPQTDASLAEALGAMYDATAEEPEDRSINVRAVTATV